MEAAKFRFEASVGQGGKAALEYLPMRGMNDGGSLRLNDGVPENVIPHRAVRLVVSRTSLPSDAAVSSY